jgi:hypothetical protein
MTILDYFYLNIVKRFKMYPNTVNKEFFFLSFFFKLGYDMITAEYKLVYQRLTSPSRNVSLLIKFTETRGSTYVGAVNMETQPNTVFVLTAFVKELTYDLYDGQLV